MKKLKYLLQVIIGKLKIFNRWVIKAIENCYPAAQPLYKFRGVIYFFSNLRKSSDQVKNHTVGRKNVLLTKMVLI